MKNSFYKNRALSLGILLSAATFVSCVKDKAITITEPARYTSSDIKSYADLFKVFWTVMDQRYAYFLEQYQRNGQDWSEVYNEYYPKFEALKTWGKEGSTDEEIANDTKLANKYFEDIIDPIIDMHFSVKIIMPYKKGESREYNYFGDLKNTEIPPQNPLTFAYMKQRLTGNIIEHSPVLAGNLLSNPDIYYISLERFSLNKTFNLKTDLDEMYFNPQPENKYLLTTAEIDNNAELNAIQDADSRKRVRDLTNDLLKNWDAFFKWEEIKMFIDYVSQFKNTEIVSDDFNRVTAGISDSLYKLKPYDKESTYSSVRTDATGEYLNWFVWRMYQHAEMGYKLSSLEKAIQSVLAKGFFYTRLLNPLQKGDIKKVIIDVRANGGGDGFDLTYFTSRFATQKTIYAYQRLKEGNGRFNYTPWTPVYTKPHQFGVPNSIPIVILTDKGTGSTSEISTLMLRSQGKHIISIGDYSSGATAALTNGDDFNGGSRDKVAGGFLEFYVPIMAVKDGNENVIEGIGIKPDIYVEPLSKDEINTILSSPQTFKDRVLEEAVKHLSTQ